MTDRAAAFAAALQDLEREGDVDRFVDAVFADGAQLSRPETGQQLHGAGGAREFWQQYLGQFDGVRSEFGRVQDSGDLGVLEWTSTGRLRSGGDITYRGVSLLDYDSDGKVTRFATYYDTAQFTM